MVGKGEKAGTVVLACVLMATASGCGGSRPADSQSGSAQLLPTVLSANQLKQRNIVKITQCAANSAEDLLLAGTVTNVLPRPAGL